MTAVGQLRTGARRARVVARALFRRIRRTLVGWSDPVFTWFETRIDPFPAQVGQPLPPQNLLGFYWYFVKPIWPAMAALLACSAVYSAIEVSLFAFVGNLVDRMREASSPETFMSDNAGLLLLMAFVALVARPLTSLAHELIKAQTIAAPFTVRIRWLSHAHVIRQSLGYFQNDFAGRLSNRVMTTGHALRETVVQLIDSVFHVFAYWLGALILFAQADLLLVWPLIVWLAVYAAALSYFVPRIQQLSARSSEARSMLMGRITDSYTNILTVKLFAHAEREEAYGREGMQHHLERLRAQLRVITAMDLCLYTLNGLLLTTMTGLALWLWSHGAVTVGAIALVTGLVIRIINMSGWIMWTMIGVFENIGVVQEGMETISKPHSVVDRPGAPPLTVSRGEIRFDQIRFHYGKEGGVIDDLSLTIQPGEKVGLVGRSGAGKSTLVNLLLRFYDLEQGRILIDGQDIAGVQQDSLRAQIGMVTQDTSLLHRAVRDNILYGRPDAGSEGAIAASSKAQAHEFVQGLEDMKGRRGYLAHVGERGVKLSGGQRQRIAIARVLLKDAPILVLDEATSALDSEVEAAIQEQLYNLMQGKTVIAIAHRLSTIAAMDRLIVMDHGRIIEDGSHETLLRRGGLYAELWARQSGGFLAKEAAE